MSFNTYFRASSYAMIAVATLGLVVAGAFHIGLAVLFAVLMLLTWLCEGKRWQLSERSGLVLVLLSLPVFYFDWAYQAANLRVPGAGPGQTNPLVAAIADLIVFLSAIKLLQVKADRDWVFLYLISFFEVLLAAGLSFSPVFLASLIVYLVCALSTIMAFEIRKARQTLTPVETRLLVSPDSMVFRRLARHGARASVEVRRLPVIAGVLLVLICVLALPLFLAAPRGSSGAFARSGQASGNFVGFSENVTLGEIGTLKLNDDIVMHVRVEGTDLARDLKWRGTGLDEFTGRGWKKSLESRRSDQPPGERGFFKLGTTEALHRLTTQSFYLEPMDTPIVFAAPRAVALQGSFPYLRIDGDGSIQSRNHESERVFYKAISDIARPDAELLRRDTRPYAESFARYHWVSQTLDPRIAALAETMIAKAHARNRFDKAKAIEQGLQSDFAYTLQLKASGPDPLSDFLFNVRAGHCEYFSTAMAVMLRTQGIATRVVNGFLSGEYNEAAGAYTVRQSDAHSWVEVYFPETRSWVTFDPTPPTGRAQPTHTGFTALLGKYGEAFELIWFQYVVGYDKQEQRSLATSLNSKLFSYRRSLSQVMNELRQTPSLFLRKAISLVCLAALVLVGWFLARRVRGLGWRRGLRLTRLKEEAGRSPVEFYERLAKALAERGLKRAPDETPLEFAVAAGQSEALAITNAYNRVRYGADRLSADESAQIERLLRTLETSAVT